MKLKSLASLLGCWMLSAATGMGLLQAAEKPNLVILLLDDAGWTDVGCYGSQIETPHIDRLADEGMRFTDYHAPAPNCSPSRAGLLTGRTPSRMGIYSYLPGNHVMHLRAEEVTVAELVKQAGYHTGHFGKWHLSQLDSDQPGPAEQGFDYSLGTDNNAAPSHRDPVNFIRNGQPVGKMEGYSCQIVVDETISWLDQIGAGNDAAPFFACLWFHEPHTPIASPPALVEKYQQRFPQLNQKQATYYANIENVDLAIGRLLQRLDELSLRDETLVFFASDNGPLNDFSAVGLRGQKSHVWEGGHRVPGIIRWPGHIAAGSECNLPVCGIDYLPTICDVLQLEPPRDRELDGTSILPLLRGDLDGFRRAKPLYWFFYRLNPALALRDGDWSLIADSNDAARPKAHQLTREDMPHIQASQPVEFQLFNLANDLGQQHDLAQSHPEQRDRLRAAMESMHRDVLADAPRWDIPANYNAGSPRKIWDSH